MLEFSHGPPVIATKMSYIDDFVALGIIGLLGAMSPGPDFAIATQSSLKYGKKAGTFTSLGITFGCAVHITYCALGIGVIVAESVFLFNALRYLGAAYLIYLGIKGILSSHTAKLNATHLNQATISNLEAFKKGFLVNILNPKVTLFILSVFTQLIDPHTPLLIQAFLGLEFCIITFCWFTSLAYVLTHPILNSKLLSVQHYIEKLLGGFLIVLGLKVALSV